MRTPEWRSGVAHFCTVAQRKSGGLLIRQMEVRVLPVQPLRVCRSGAGRRRVSKTCRGGFDSFTACQSPSMPRWSSWQDVPLSAGRQGFNSPTRRHATIAQQVEHSVEARGALVRYQFVAPRSSGSSSKVGAPVRSRDWAGSIPAALTMVAGSRPVASRLALRRRDSTPPSSAIQKSPCRPKVRIVGFQPADEGSSPSGDAVETSMRRCAWRSERSFAQRPLSRFSFDGTRPASNRARSFHTRPDTPQLSRVRLPPRISVRVAQW